MGPSISTTRQLVVKLWAGHFLWHLLTAGQLQWGKQACLHLSRVVVPAS